MCTCVRLFCNQSWRLWGVCRLPPTPTTPVVSPPSLLSGRNSSTPSSLPVPAFCPRGVFPEVDASVGTWTGPRGRCVRSWTSRGVSRRVPRGPSRVPDVVGAPVEEVMVRLFHHTEVVTESSSRSDGGVWITLSGSESLRRVTSCRGSGWFPTGVVSTPEDLRCPGLRPGVRTSQEG